MSSFIYQFIDFWYIMFNYYSVGLSLAFLVWRTSKLTWNICVLSAYKVGVAQFDMLINLIVVINNKI